MSSIKIEGMRCGHCTASVETAMKAVPGAGNVTVSLEKGEATWDGTASAEAMRAAIEGQGFVCPVA